MSIPPLAVPIDAGGPAPVGWKGDLIGDGNPEKALNGGSELSRVVDGELPSPNPSRRSVRPSIAVSIAKVSGYLRQSITIFISSI